MIPRRQLTMFRRLWLALHVRRCRGCDEPDPHDHHLTALGRWRYLRR